MIFHFDEAAGQPQKGCAVLKWMYSCMHEQEVTKIEMGRPRNHCSQIFRVQIIFQLCRYLLPTVRFCRQTKLGHDPVTAQHSPEVEILWVFERQHQNKIMIAGKNM